jgi:hypothetical protein
MGVIPKGDRWYLADVVLEHVIEGERRNLVHVNSHLVEAASPEEAYKKAGALGRMHQHRYLNTDGMRVRVKFRGLRDLHLTLDPPGDGAEITYDELVAIPETKLKRLVSPKKDLGVFAPRRPRRSYPNTMPLTIMREMEAAGFSRADVEGRPKRVRRKRPSSSGGKKARQSVAARSRRPKARAR